MSSATIYYAIVFSKKANTFAKGKTKAKTILGKFGLIKFAHGKFALYRVFQNKTSRKPENLSSDLINR